MQTDTHRANIQALIEAGFALFPCSSNRVPLSKGWRETVNDKNANPDDFGDCVGINLQPDDLILDYDPRRENSEQSHQLNELWVNLGLPNPFETYIVQSGGKEVFNKSGVHIYTKKPEHFPVKASTIPGYGCIEIKSAGQYVIAAGSKHESGRHYEVLRANPKLILPTPPQLLTVCQKTAKEIKDDEIEDDSPANKAKFTNYIIHGGHEQSAYVIANKGKDFGLSQDSIVEIMVEYCNHFWLNDPISESTARTKVAHAFEYGQNSQGAKTSKNTWKSEAAPKQDKPTGPKTGLQVLGYDFDLKTGALLPSLRNTINYLILPTYHAVDKQEHPNPLYKALQYNMFSHNIELLKPMPWHDNLEPIKFWRDVDSILLKTWLTQNTALYNVPTSVIEDAVITVAHHAQYHPVREWLKSIVWDKKQRLNMWLTTYAGAPDTLYTRECARITFLAAVARVMKPGCKHDTMLILEGNQGIGKSRLVEVIGGKWFADVTIDPHARDCIEAMQGAWILEASELEFLNRTDSNALKRFLSLTVDKVRLAYAKRSAELPRQSLFIGTVNPGPEGYLRDTTGNRRYLPVYCKTIDVDGFKSDREQIFAEAYYRYMKGEKWYTDNPQVEFVMNSEQNKRVAQNEWAEIIGSYIDGHSDILPTPLTSAVIASECLGIPRSKMNNKMLVRELNEAIRQAGFVEVHRYCPKAKRSVKAWERKPIYDTGGL